MSTSLISNYWGNVILGAYLSTKSVWLSLHTADPTVLGNPSTEVVGANYKRQLISFGSGGAKTVVSTNSQTFPGIPATTVTHLGLWDAQVAGNFLLSIPLSPPITASELAHFLAAPGDVAVML